MKKRVVIVPMERLSANGHLTEMSDEESRLYLGVSAVPCPNDKECADKIDDIDAYITAHPEFDLSHTLQKSHIGNGVSMLKLEMTTGEEGEVFVSTLELDSASLETPVGDGSARQFLLKYLFFGTYDIFSEYKMISTIRMDAHEEAESVELAIFKGNTIRQLVFKFTVSKVPGVSVNLFDFFFHLNRQHMRLKTMAKYLEEDRAALKCQINQKSQSLINLRQNYERLETNFSKKVPLLLNAKKSKIRQQWQEINALLLKLGEKPKYGVYDSWESLRYDPLKNENQLLERVERRQHELGARKRPANDDLRNPAPKKHGEFATFRSPPSTQTRPIKMEPLTSPVTASANYQGVMEAPSEEVGTKSPSAHIASPIPSEESDATDYSTGADDDGEVVETQPDSLSNWTTDTFPDQ